MTWQTVRWLTALLVSALLITAISVLVHLSHPSLPTLGLTVLYMFAVLPVAAVVAGELAARLRRVAVQSERLSREQSALRRVATLVARSAPPSTVFEAVTREVGRLCGADLARMERYEENGTVIGVAGWSTMPVRLAIGTRLSLDGLSIARGVRHTGGPVRVDSFGQDTGAIAREAREIGIRSSVGCPIFVAGRLWGVIAASTKSEEPFPAGTESQIFRFTELVATAVENTESRIEVNRLAEEQAALRRVATLVATGAAPQEVLAAVTDEVAHLLDLDVTILVRFEAEEMSRLLSGGWSGEEPRLGKNVKVPGTLAVLRDTGDPVRVDDLGRTPELADAVGDEGVVGIVFCPIIVEGRIWGAFGVGSRTGRLPDDAERRLLDFTELIETAIANAESRAEVTRLLDEQAALRRVATLVAQGVSPENVFHTVTEQVGRVLHADSATMIRLTADGGTTIVAREGSQPDPIESEWAIKKAVRTGRPARRDSIAGRSGTPAGTCVTKVGESAVALPIIVAGRTRGVLSMANHHKTFPADIERRMAGFTELVAMAVANADSRAELKASRIRVITAADQARRRLERDLHDGAQQRLVTLGLELRLAADAVPSDLPDLRSEISHTADEVNEVFNELRDISHGIHPAILSKGGLGPALHNLARRSKIPVELDIKTERHFPEPVEVTAYCVVAEALTNTTKHADGAGAGIVVQEQDASLRLLVRDTGPGGADATHGSGLIGLRDRVESLGGTIDITSPPGHGTSITVSLPTQILD